MEARVTFAAASTALHDLLRGGPRPARVVAALPSAVYLEVGSGPAPVSAAAPGPAIIALLARDAVRVPVGVVVALPRGAEPFARIGEATWASVGDGAVRIGAAASGDPTGEVYRPMRWWDPRVPRLRAGLSGPGARHRADALTSLQAGLPVQVLAALPALAAAMHPAAPDPGEVARAVRGLAGLGPGLTPAGDDVLCGTLVALAACCDDDRGGPLAAAARQAAASGATTPISAALLEQAGAGRGIPEVNALLRALAGSADLDDALVRLAQVGHTSGAALGAGVRLAVQARGPGALGRVA